MLGLGDLQDPATDGWSSWPGLVLLGQSPKTLMLQLFLGEG